ncbi:MAG: heat-inducible transcription repressor HrcA [Oscillospiraceae bacterium]|nr:heat-inducible transcription repressor HrcA [Oscillospiraceae bacterium]
MELSERKRRILKAIVEQYISTAEPVGSKAIAADPEMNLSSATIRNEMAELTAMGLLEQPHTSAGRVPSPQGYRIYVNELMNEHRLSLEETQEINRALKQKMSQLDSLLEDAGKVVSELTSYPAYALTTQVGRRTVQRYDLIHVDGETVIAVLLLEDGTACNRVMKFPGGIEKELVQRLATVFNAGFTNLTAQEIDSAMIRAAERTLGDEIGAAAALASFTISTLESGGSKKVLSGVSNLLTLPEYQDVNKAHKLMDFLAEGRELEQMEMPQGQEGVQILIGPENVAEELKDSGVVLATYPLGNNMQGVIGVVGPTRMDYAKVAAYLSYIAGGMQQISQGTSPPQLPEPGPAKEQDEGR